jgi:uncharacterized peroxidase-related enzyme
MARFAIPKEDDTHSDSKPTLNAVQKMLGWTPNLHRLMSLSPPALNGWAALQASLNKTLDLKTRDAIALAVSEVNGCHYCLSAHTYLSQTFASLSEEEIARNRRGESEDPKRAAAATFAKELVERRGAVTDEALAKVKAAGFSEGDVVSMIALSAQFLLTNFMNNAAQTDIDFPVVEFAGK